MAETEQALSDLATLGTALAEVAGNKQKQAKVIDLILDKFATIDADTAKLLLKDDRIQNLLEQISHEKAQSSDDPPGTIRPGWIGNAQVSGFTKKEWTEADLRNRRDSAGRLVTFTPTETIPVFWNGLRRQFIADEEITIEKCFYDVYMEHRRATKVAKEMQEYLFRKRETLSDISAVTAEAARARGMGETGWFVPGGGSIISVEAATASNNEGEESVPATGSGSQ